MKIQISKPTPLANAPDELCYAINKWTPHQAFMSNEPSEYADIIMFSNAYFPTDVPAAIWYHSEPEWPGVMLDCPYRKLVNAQYHATLPEYADCTPVRNVINFDRPEYNIKPIHNPRIAYSPSAKKNVGRWHHKGYKETNAALKASGLKHDIITDVPLCECLERKRNCSIVIDECVTGSYHRSALEGLAMGKVVVGYLSDEVNAVATKACGAWLPIRNTRMYELGDTLKGLTETNLVKDGFMNRVWMLNNWHPARIANEFVKIFEEVINEK